MLTGFRLEATTDTTGKNGTWDLSLFSAGGKGSVSIYSSGNWSEKTALDQQQFYTRTLSCQGR